MKLEQEQSGAQATPRFVVRITSTGVARIIHSEGCRSLDGAGHIFAPFISREMAGEIARQGVRACKRCNPLSI